MTDEEMKNAASQLLTSVAALAAHDRLVALKLNEAGDKFLKLSGLINSARISVTWDGDKAAELAPIKPSIAPEDIERGKKYRVAFDGVAVNCASHGLAVSNIYLEFNDAALDCASRIEEIDPIGGDNK
jgi:hypothetical protein